jgi:uncharacterized membrane protein (DUF485 family)
MFKIRIHSQFTKFFLALTLIFFVSSASLSLLHAFSHHEVVSSKASLIKAEDEHKNFFEKIIFFHKTSAGSKSQNCFLCSFSNSQSHITLLANVIFCTMGFYLVFAARQFDRAKLSYLLFSKAPRAPPVIS